MPDPATNQSHRLNRWANTAMVLVLLAAVAGFFYARFSMSAQGTDFPDFYCASRMLIEGHGHQLYDADFQREFQVRCAGRVGTLFIHPPFETLAYLAVGWLPLKRAYLLWCLINLAVLALVARKIACEVLTKWRWQLLLAASLTFVPVMLCFLQGQDSVLLLLLVTLTFAALKRERAFAAGCWLGLGLFKFQIVLPLVLVITMQVAAKQKAMQRGMQRKGNSFLYGFAFVAAALAALSGVISGWSVFIAYPRFLFRLQEQPFAGVDPQAMANFRGLLYFFVHGDGSAFVLIAIAISSGAALLTTGMGWKQAYKSVPIRGLRKTTNSATFNLAFSNSVLFALLVSYHLNPHDLSLLLLPMSLLLRHLQLKIPPGEPAVHWLAASLLAILLLPPLHLAALRAHEYVLVVVPMLAVFVIETSMLRQNRAASVN